MNFDYIEASIFTHKDNINLSDLSYYNINNKGISTFFDMEEHKEIKIIYNEPTKELKLKGSLPYYIEGQNFSNEMIKIEESIYTLSEKLNINLFNAEVKVLDTGITLQVPKHPKEYIYSHTAIPRFKSVLFGNTKYFNGKNIVFKMYDSGANIKAKVSKEVRNYLEAEKGYNPSDYYLRLEVKHKKPSAYFQTPNLSIGEIFRPNFINNCKVEIMKNYKAIKKEGYFDYPKEKRSLTLPTIELMALKELGLIYGFSPEEYLKRQIKGIPECILNKEDKKNRIRALRELNKKINIKDTSDFDLSKLLEKALNL